MIINRDILSRLKLLKSITLHPKLWQLFRRKSVYVFCVCLLAEPQRDYEIFAPSNPQAVNQYVREYNYYAGDDDDEAEYDDAMQQYQAALSRE